MLYLGDEVLKVLQVDKHLGIPLVTDPRLGIDIINGYISKGKRSFYASLGLGSRYHPVPPLDFLQTVLVRCYSPDDIWLGTYAS